MFFKNCSLTIQFVFHYDTVYWRELIVVNFDAGYWHIQTQEGLICMHGSFTVLIDNGHTKTEYFLDTPAKVLLMEIGDWHVMYNLSPDAVLMGMASTNYDPKDYAYEPLKFD